MKKILNMSFFAKKAHGTFGSGHGGDTPHIISWGDPSDFEKRESTRETKAAETHIPLSGIKTGNRYANLPHQLSHPRLSLGQRRRNGRSSFSSLFSSSFGTTQSLQAKLFLNNVVGWHGPMSTLDETDFPSCRLRTYAATGTAVPLRSCQVLFRLEYFVEGNHLLSTLSAFLLVWYTRTFPWRRIQQQSMYTAYLLCFLLISCAWRLSTVKFTNYELQNLMFVLNYLHFTWKTNVESDSYKLFRGSAALPYPNNGSRRMPAPMRSSCMYIWLFALVIKWLPSNKCYSLFINTYMSWMWC